MNRYTIVLGLAACLVGGLGCARRVARDSLPNLVIPVACVSEITLLRCDAVVSPPKCESARVRYKHGCEQIAVR